MRGSRWFIFFVLAFLLLMFAIEYHLPKKFVWVPTAFGIYTVPKDFLSDGTGRYCSQ